MIQYVDAEGRINCIELQDINNNVTTTKLKECVGDETLQKEILNIFNENNGDVLL